jgi:hypothetical protein
LVIWYILSSFGIFFLVWYAAPGKNLATLNNTADKKRFLACADSSWSQSYGF